MSNPLTLKLGNFFPRVKIIKNEHVLNTLKEAIVNTAMQYETNEEYIYDISKSNVIITTKDFYQCLDMLDEVNKTFIPLVRYDYNTQLIHGRDITGPILNWANIYTNIIYSKKYNKTVLTICSMYHQPHNLLRMHNTYQEDPFYITLQRNPSIINNRGVYSCYVNEEYNINFVITSVDDINFNIELVPFKFNNNIKVIYNDCSLTYCDTSDLDTLRSMFSYKVLVDVTDKRKYQFNPLEIKNRQNKKILEVKEG